MLPAPFVAVSRALVVSGMIAACCTPLSVQAQGAKEARFFAAPHADQCPWIAQASELDQYFQRSTLQVATTDARLHSFEVWVADNGPRQSRGLMCLDSLPDNRGMLFIYPDPREISIWMKNTTVALDLLFVSAKGKITHIVQNAEPLSLESMSSRGDAKGVIELKAGTVAKLNIRTGAQVIHPAFARR